MKQSLQIKMGQSLAMTPQLQQAIKLLQLSTLELQTEIQTALESNPMLEMQDEEGVEPREADLANESRETREANREEEKAAAEQKQTAAESEVMGEAQSTGEDVLPEDLPVDSAWDDIYDSATPSSSGSGSDGESRDFTEFHNAGLASIQDHLNEQIRFAPLSERDQEIAETIIDAIDNNGYLIDGVDVLLDGLNRDIVDPEQMFVLDLAAHDFAKLRRLFKISDELLQEAIALIRSLNPRPGRQLVNDHDEYIVPDVFVKKVKGVWRVELNPDIAPKLGINALYAGMVKRADKSEDNNFMRNHLQEARWFIKSLQSRNETLLRVGTAIVERQRSFLEYGDEAMKPLVLRDIAEQLSLHESTISRVTTHKYIHTPRGIFEFKYFFSSHVSTANGGECSATAIRAMIRKFIAAEDATKPLSDSKIASTLVAEGIQVARRTVAKYRESMAIPPSNERKRFYASSILPAIRVGYRGALGLPPPSDRSRKAPNLTAGKVSTSLHSSLNAS